MSIVHTSEVGFWARPILKGTFEAGSTKFKFKAYKIGDHVEIHTYIKRVPINTKMQIIKMTYAQFLRQFIPILNIERQPLVIDGTEIAPGTWKAKKDDIRKYRHIGDELTQPLLYSQGGKSRRRCKRSKKRSRKTMHRRSRR